MATNMKWFLLATALVSFIMTVGLIFNFDPTDLTNAFLPPVRVAALSRPTTMSPRHAIKYKYYPSGDPFHFSCRSCAFVVASGHMIDAKKGREIDGNDCVLRPNDSPTTDYEVDVGGKTTMRSVDHRSLEFIKKRILSGRTFDKQLRNMTFLVFTSENSTDWHKVTGQIAYLHKSHSGVKFVIHEREWMKFVVDKFRNEVDNSTNDIWISNGFYSLLFLHEICSNISVYGMSHPKYCYETGNNDVQYHYYFGYSGLECATFMQHANAEGSTHRFLTEKFTFDKWRHTWKNLKFQYPSWPVVKYEDNHTTQPFENKNK